MTKKSSNKLDLVDDLPPDEPSVSEYYEVFVREERIIAKGLHLVRRAYKFPVDADALAMADDSYERTVLTGPQVEFLSNHPTTAVRRRIME